MIDKPREECGVIGIFNNDEISLAHEIYLGLYALQHRGQLSCGIAVSHGSNVVDFYKRSGTVPEVFNDDILKSLNEKSKGRAALGHVRYSQSEFSEQSNAQPLVMRYAQGALSISFNGCLVNSNELRIELQNLGAIFQTGSDAEIIGYLIARQRIKTQCTEQAISDIMPRLRGAYSMVIMTPKKLIAVRDPNGFRPLCIGKINNSFIVSSESCAIAGIGGEFLRDIKPGEILVINKRGLLSIETPIEKTSLCIFEHIYFARIDSTIDGKSVSEFRRNAGAILAREYPVDADVVIGVPDSGLEAAIGYSYESGIPFEIGFIKNRYVGRTFIQDTQEQRERLVKIKLNPVRSAVEGKNVVLIDDSIVRGTTSAHIVELLKNAGAKSVHMRISSPPFMNPCYYGTDISSRDYLIACKLTHDEICRHIGADSLGYLRMESLEKIAKNLNLNFCAACFNGDYPIEIPEDKHVDRFAEKIQSVTSKK